MSIGVFDSGVGGLSVHRALVAAMPVADFIYLGDHVRARVALAGNDDFTVKRPIDEAHRLPQTGGAVNLAWAVS